MEPVLRQLKIIQMALLAGVAFYVAIAEAAGPKKGEPLPIIILAAGGLSLWGAFSCFWIRRRLVFSKTTMILHIEPENAAALHS